MTKAFSTRAVRSGIDCDSAFGAVIAPLVLSANFSFEGIGGKRRYDYSRSGNPSRDLLAEALASLEGGTGAIVTASGMAAVALVIHAILKPGDRLLFPNDCYSGSSRLFSALGEKGSFFLESCDFTDPKALDEAIARKPSLIWVETPSNPLLKITDLGAVTRRAKSVGALVVVDNTFLSPALQRPLELGADIVIHSTTKFINGHSDIVGGAVIANDQAILDELSWWANSLGLTGSPFDCYLTLRGLRTLEARMKIQEENAQAIAERLSTSACVSSVYYPGLPTHPGHDIARSQQSGFGAMLSLDLGSEDAVVAFVDGLSCFTLAESLGGVESLIAYPATMNLCSGE